MGFKPIFEEERLFINKKLGIELPKNCWRDSGKIYLDPTQPFPYLQFSVNNGKMSIFRDYRNGKVTNKRTI